jgi:outer membrane protein assembly factor BamB
VFRSTETSVRATLARMKTSTARPTPEIKTAWAFQAGGATWGSPSLSDGVLYTGSDVGLLYALDMNTGQPKWKFATQGIVSSRPVLEQDLVFIASDDGFLYAIDTRDGSLKWRKDIGNLEPREKREKLVNSPDPSGYDYPARINPLPWCRMA